MTPLNEELIERVLARIEADPTAWDQGDFFRATKSEGSFCGTSACFAGHALLESGWTIGLSVSRAWPLGVKMVIRDPDGRPNFDYASEAEKLLGFTEDESDRVFYATQTDCIAEMRDVIDVIRAGRAEIEES